MSTADFQDCTTDVPRTRNGSGRSARAARLHVVYPPALVERYSLSQAPLTLGRKPTDGSPPLLHRLISREHFRIEWDPGRHVHAGRDLGSSNGSTVDGVPASAPIALRNGSVIRVGPALLVYETAQVEPTEGASSRVSQTAIPGASFAAERLRSEVARVADDPSAALLLGETGTGKEFVAAELHRLSGRRGAFVAVNCAALASQLVESELFGHVKGAFSGAHGHHTGLVRAAERGTLFLDEVGELAAELQPKLLRMLQQKTVRAVGATRDLPVDVRVVAATNRDLHALVEAGTFRRDLLARLTLWELRLPSLRARRADIFTWLARLHDRFAAERGRAPGPLPDFEPEAAELILRGAFRQNLRDLDRLVHALDGLSADAPITPTSLPEWVKSDGATAEAGEPGPGAGHGSAEDQAPGRAAGRREPRATPAPAELAAAMERFDGSVRAVAKHFERDRRQIYRWLQAYGMADKRAADKPQTGE